MNTFIEKNKKWLKFYSIASRILGWVIILFASFSVLYMMRISWSMTWRISEERREFLIILGTIIERVFGRIPVGVTLLGVGQLLKYTCEDDKKTPWLLQNGAKMLYLLAIMEGLRPFILWLYRSNMHMPVQQTAIFTYLANVLILIGLGNILKRVLPIIEEHKSLV